MALISFEDILLSVLVNAIGLILVMLTKSAPPRLVFYICLASMFAIFIPWTSLGGGLQAYIPANTLPSIVLSGASDAAASVAAEEGFLAHGLTMLWLLPGAIWTAAVFVRSIHARRRLRFVACEAVSFARYGDPAFTKVFSRSRIYRLPNTFSVFTTGFWRPEIWIGEQLRTEPQIRAALNHELSHIASKDQWALLCIVVLERFLWWNPLIWWLGQQARYHMEYACDARCQALLGAVEYRRTLAELFLQQPLRNAELELSLGNGSDVITRMEKIGMPQTLKLKHVVSLIGGSLLIVAASTNLAAQTRPENRTLIQCYELLPDGVQYEFRITSEIDTRAVERGHLSVSLTDPKNPDSSDIPNGAGAFLQCVQKVVGVRGDEDWPEV